jgi:hypothetical protein
MKTNPLRCGLLLAAAAALGLGLASSSQAACCYFSAKNADILQPAQKVFITWDPAEKVETFTVQPKFEGNALDFGMVIPTPTEPKLHEMPRDFFSHLAIYTIMKKREVPRSKLLPREMYRLAAGLGGGGKSAKKDSADADNGAEQAKKPPVRILQEGSVGSLEFKVLEADRADALFDWLKKHKYSYSGDEQTLQFYIQKKWIFTVMKIDTAQMKRNKDGTFSGNVTPTRFTFSTEKLIYPLKITQISVRERTEALFYVQAPFKVDLPGDMSYQYNWLTMLDWSRGCQGGIPGRGQIWLDDMKAQIPALMARANELNFRFQPRQRPQPNAKGHIPTTMEWARKLTVDDVKILRGEAPYSEKVPDVDEGFTQADMKDPQRAAAIEKVIRARLAKCQKERPIGYLVREAPADDVRDLSKLLGHVRDGLFITKFRKVFARDEMNDDLAIVPARYNGAEDTSEYEEMLPSSPP